MYLLSLFPQASSNILEFTLNCKADMKINPSKESITNCAIRYPGVYFEVRSLGKFNKLE